MKRYRIKVGDLKLIEEHPAGDLVSLKEVLEFLEGREPPYPEAVEVIHWLKTA